MSEPVMSVGGDVPAALKERLEHVSRKLERLGRRRPRGVSGPAGLLSTLLGVATLQGREARSRRARRRWRRTLRRRAEARAELRELQQRIAVISATRAELVGFLESGARLAFPPAGAAPDVTVLIVAWNQAHFVLKCLRALRAEPPGPAIEVLVVDNASGPETRELLARIDGLTVIRNPRNAGFLLACNQGAEAARGRAILLLNSDAFVRTGALAAALATLDSAADIGAVGGRLIMPNGRLQEAGCEVASDGMTRGLCRGLPPETGEAMVRRDVDYCSGAFLLIETALWRRLGGFDPAYAPGYYEEADFCLRLKDAGRRVVYEPMAVIDHFEFGSEAEAGDALRASERNRATFTARHAAALRGRPAPDRFPARNHRAT